MYHTVKHTYFISAEWKVQNKLKTVYVNDEYVCEVFLLSDSSSQQEGFFFSFVRGLMGSSLLFELRKCKMKRSAGGKLLNNSPKYSAGRIFGEIPGSPLGRACLERFARHVNRTEGCSSVVVERRMQQPEWSQGRQKTYALLGRKIKFSFL